jgi:hypothetical protein
VSVSSHTMQTFPDKEPGAGQYHISVCIVLVVTSVSCMSQFRIRDEGSHGAKVQIHCSKMESMKRIPSVRFDQLNKFLSLTQSD